jgi:hypothetical protein
MTGNIQKTRYLDADAQKSLVGGAGGRAFDHFAALDDKLIMGQRQAVMMLFFRGWMLGAPFPEILERLTSVDHGHLWRILGHVGHSKKLLAFDRVEYLAQGFLRRFQQGCIGLPAGVLLWPLVPDPVVRKPGASPPRVRSSGKSRPSRSHRRNVVGVTPKN